MARTYLGDRIVASHRFALLAAGDLLALLAFAAAGQFRHGGTVDAALLTAAEFGIGWALVAVAFGAYGPRALDSPLRAAGLAAVAWSLGAVVGAAVRVAVEPHAQFAPVFVLVTAGVGAVVFAAWRALAAWRLG